MRFPATATKGRNDALAEWWDTPGCDLLHVGKLCEADMPVRAGLLCGEEFSEASSNLAQCNRSNRLTKEAQVIRFEHASLFSTWPPTSWFAAVVLFAGGVAWAVSKWKGN